MNTCSTCMHVYNTCIHHVCAWSCSSSHGTMDSNHVEINFLLLFGSFLFLTFYQVGASERNKKSKMKNVSPCPGVEPWPHAQKSWVETTTLTGCVGGKESTTIITELHALVHVLPVLYWEQHFFLNDLWIFMNSICTEASNFVMIVVLSSPPAQQVSVMVSTQDI